MNKSLVLLIVLGLIFYSLWQTPQMTSEENKQTDVNNGIEVDDSGLDLCSLFYPYIVAGNLPLQCNLLGGEWVCEDNFVGCIEVEDNLIDCSNEIYLSALAECDNLGAKSICNTNEIKCSY